MRILIVKVSSLGDVIHTLPAVTDAKRAHRNLVFDWVVEENFAEVPAWHPAVDNVIPVAMRRWRKNLLKTYLNHEYSDFKKSLQNIHYDLVIDAQGLIKSGIISRISRGLTVGLSNKTIREPLATVFYNKVYSVPWDDHAVDRLRQLFSRALSYDYDPRLIDYGIDLSRLQKNNPGTGNTGLDKKVVFLHGTTWTTKHWPQYYWRHLAYIAAENGYQVLLPWGNDAELQRAKFIAKDNSAVTILEKQNLSGIAGHILDSKGVIAVDTGLGHLAAALSRPGLSLYGATNPGLSGTFGDRQLQLKSNLNCSPCLKKNCGYTGPGITDEFQGQSYAVTPPCFASNKPDAVWREFEKLVSG